MAAFSGLANKGSTIVNPFLLSSHTLQETAGARKNPFYVSAADFSDEGKLIANTLEPGPMQYNHQGPVMFSSAANPNISSAANPIMTLWHDSAGQETAHAESIQHDLDAFVAGLCSTKCVDSSMKFDLLDKIDKQIRKLTRADRKQFKRLKGTCLDMCPEKERYHRDDRHQVNFFEADEDQSSFEGGYPVLDHARAVKEYQRSSADQEEPLPHELRPANVLRMTMNYLIAHVMTQTACKVSDWFDFLWNRTRAIRKDITQQLLSCSTSIGLIEECARFHIFCAHHLCEEDMHVFDPKINDENLTKCLQSLKYMYEDQSQKGETSCNEGEFRSYQILLNLNSGDILREVTWFNARIQSSGAVQFALAVASAVQENNYVRFFKLLRSASLLNACIMHRYFYQLRVTGLQRLSQAVSVSKSTAAFPLQKLLHLFAFNSSDEAATFCKQHGFSVVDDCVIFSRTSYFLPESARIPCSKSHIIAGKLFTSIAEVVRGGPVPELELRIPTNSFSVEGCYQGSYHVLECESDEMSEASRSGSSDVDLSSYHGEFVLNAEEPLNSGNFLLKSTETNRIDEGNVASVENPLALDVSAQDARDSHFYGVQARPLSVHDEDGMPVCEGESSTLLSESQRAKSSSARLVTPLVKVGDAMEPFLEYGVVPETVTPATSSAFYLPHGMLMQKMLPYECRSFTLCRDDASQQAWVADAVLPDVDPTSTSPDEGLLASDRDISASYDPDFILSKEEAVKAAQKQEILSPSRQMILREDIKDYARYILSGVVQEILGEVSFEVLEEVKISCLDMEAVVNQYLAFVIIQETRKIAYEAVLEERKGLFLSYQQFVQKAVDEIADGMTEHVINMVVKDISAEMFRLEMRSAELHAENDMTANFVEALCSSICLMEAGDIVKEVISHAKRKRKDSLALLHSNFRSVRAAAVFKRWLSVFKSRTKQKFAASFPATVPLYNASALMKLIKPSWLRSAHSQQAERDGLDSYSILTCPSIELNRQLHKSAVKDFHERIALQREHLVAPLDVGNIILLHYPFTAEVDHKIQWKLVLCVPNLQKTNISAQELSLPLVKEKFRSEGYRVANCQFDQSEILQLRPVPTKSGCLLDLCVKAVCPGDSKQGHLLIKNKDLYGTSALLYLIDIPVLAEKGFWETERDLLQMMLLSKPPIPKVPVAVIALSSKKSVHSNENNEVAVKLQLDKLKLDNLLDSYTCLVISRKCTSAAVFNEQLVSLVTWLVERAPSFPTFCVDDLSNFIEKGVSRLFSKPFHHRTSISEEMQLESLTPGEAIAFYNSVIDHLASVAASHDLHRYSWPVTEFTSTSNQGLLSDLWNDFEMLQERSKLVLALKLPDIFIADPGDWVAAESACCAFVNRLCPDSFSVLANRIAGVLERNTDEKDLFPWPQVLEECVEFQMSKMSTASVGEATSYSGKVCFFADDMESFVPPKFMKKHFIISHALPRKNSVSNRRKKLKRSSSVDMHQLSATVTNELLRIEDELLNRRKKRFTVPEFEVTNLLNLSSHMQEDVAEGKHHLGRVKLLTERTIVSGRFSDHGRASSATFLPNSFATERSPEAPLSRTSAVGSYSVFGTELDKSEALACPISDSVRQLISDVYTHRANAQRSESRLLSLLHDY